MTRKYCKDEILTLYNFPSDSYEEKIPTPEELGYPADFFDKTAGKWEGEVLGRENLVDCDRRIWDIE